MKRREIACERRRLATGIQMNNTRVDEYLESEVMVELNWKRTNA